jgi:hypothetical protein
VSSFGALPLLLDTKHLAARSRTGMQTRSCRARTSYRWTVISEEVRRLGPGRLHQRFFRSVSLTEGLDSQSDSQVNGLAWTLVDEDGLHAPFDLTPWTSMDDPGWLAEDS